MTHEELKRKIAEYKGFAKAEAWQREYRTKKAQEALKWAIEDGDSGKIQKAEKELQEAKNWTIDCNYELEFETEELEKITLSKTAALERIEDLDRDIRILEDLTDDHGYDSKVPRDMTNDEIMLSNALCERERMKMYVAICC